MITENLPLVHHVARRLAAPSTDEAEYDDLVSAGCVGLISAVENFDPGLGYSFSTYAAPRIRGAILDDLRRRDSATRGMREKRRRMARARAKVAAESLESPSDLAVAREMGVDLPTLWAWQREIRSAGRVSMDQPVDASEGGTGTILEMLRGAGPDEVEASLHSRELSEQLEAALMDLPDQDRTVLALSYFEGLKLKEIGQVLGLTESRISQIRTAALARLRERAPELAMCAA